MPKVSVVMAVFDGERYISESIDSVLAQRSVDLELIIVNDGSIDKTLEIVTAYAQADARVRVINRPNSGRPSFPKNDGIAAARGDYLCFLDHDDLYDADRTAQLVDGLDRHPQWVAAFHDLRLITSDGDCLPGTYLGDHRFLERASAYLTAMPDDWYDCGERFYVYQSLVSGALHTQSVLIAIKRLPAGTVRFDTQFTICDDTDLWIRLGLRGKMGYLHRVLSSYRQHETSITRNREKFMLDTVRLHEFNLQRIKERLSADQLKQLRSRISRGMAEVAYLRYRQWQLGQARAAYREALAWSFSREAAVGYMKTFLPVALLRGLKGLAS